MSVTRENQEGEISPTLTLRKNPHLAEVDEGGSVEPYTTDNKSSLAYESLTAMSNDEKEVGFGAEFETGDYVTWFLVLVGWVVAAAIAKLQLDRSKQDAAQQSMKDADRQKLEKLSEQVQASIIELENNSVEFWVTPSSGKDVTQISLDRFARDIKTLTRKAQKIAKLGGQEYPKAEFMTLRQSITKLEADFEPVEYGNFRITQIRTACRALRLHYKK